MAMERPKVGQRIMIDAGAMHEEATVERVVEYQDETQKGFFVDYVTDVGGHWSDYWLESEDFSSQLLSNSGMPYKDRAKAFRWDYYHANMDIAKKIANSYVEDFRTWRQNGMGLYICSSINGSGKTYLACCIGNELVYRYNAQVEFITANDYIGLITEDKDTAWQVRDSILLIFDDIGSQNEKQDWIKDALFRLVDYRYRNKLPTIYTSNMPLKQASKNDRVTSRIYERSHELKLPEVSVREILADRAKKEFLEGVLNVA